MISSLQRGGILADARRREGGGLRPRRSARLPAIRPPHRGNHDRHASGPDRSMAHADRTQAVHGRDRGRPARRAARRSGAELTEDGSRGNSWRRSRSEPRGAGEVHRDKSVLAVDATAWLDPRAKSYRRAALRGVNRSASGRRHRRPYGPWRRMSWCKRARSRRSSARDSGSAGRQDLPPSSRGSSSPSRTRTNALEHLASACSRNMAEAGRWSGRSSHPGHSTSDERR